MAGQTDGAMRPSSDEPHPVLDRDRASRARTSVLLVLMMPLVLVAFLVGHRLGADVPPAPSPSPSPSPTTATLTLPLADLEGAPWTWEGDKLVVYGCAVGVGCGYLEYDWDAHGTCRYTLTYHHRDTSGHVFTTDTGGGDCAQAVWSRTAVRVIPVAYGMIKVVPAGQAESSILLERRPGPFVSGPSSASSSPSAATLTLAQLEGTWATGATILRVHDCTVGATCGELLVRQCTYTLTYRSGDATGHTFSADGGYDFSCGGSELRVTPIGDGLIKVKLGEVASSEVIIERFAD